MTYLKAENLQLLRLLSFMEVKAPNGLGGTVCGDDRIRIARGEFIRRTQKAFKERPLTENR